MSKAKPREDTQIGYYAVAFLDLLGQKDRLEKIRKLPQTEDEKSQFIISLKESMGVVKLFRDSMLQSISVTESPPPDGLMAQHPQLSKIWSDVHRIKIRHKFFSDCLVLWVPLRGNEAGLPVPSVFRLMQSVAQLFSVALSLGYTCRGGIDVGIADENFLDELYGPALSSAYLLEHDMAKYPRVVIGNSLREYIATEREAWDENPDFSLVMRRTFAQFCTGLITSDYDGQFILDYFGPRSSWLIDGKSQGIYRNSVAFAQSQIMKYSDEGNEKLVEKYTRLYQYLQARQIHWKN